VLNPRALDRYGSSGEVNFALSLFEPGTPGTRRSESGTAQLTDALTWAGWPGEVLNPGSSRSLTTGLQCRPSARRAAFALESAA